MNYEDLKPEQKVAYDALKKLNDDLNKEISKMNATMHPKTLNGFMVHALKSEIIIENIVTLLITSKEIASIVDGVFFEH